MAGDGRKRKVMVIGLDSVPPGLLFDRWLGDLPNIRRLVEAGVYGPMRSSIPPITVPAWMSMVTGRDPGELGFYAFRNRVDYTYRPMELTTARSVRHPTVWDVLGEQGRHCVVIGVPPSYPVKPVNGELISCFLTPDTRGGAQASRAPGPSGGSVAADPSGGARHSAHEPTHPPTLQYTHPADLRGEIEALVGEYMFDVEGYRTDDAERLLRQIHEMTEKRFAVARHLLRTRPWEFFMMVEMGTDRIHHAFWKYMDPEHVLYPGGNPFQDSIYEYYRFVDARIGELLAFADEGTRVFLVSDHGAKRMDGGIALNEWLVQKGYLVLKRYPERPTPLEGLEVDWRRTRAWGDGGYYGRVFVNVRGREPEGVVAPEEYDGFRRQLKEELEALGDEDGRPIGTKVFFPEEVYRQTRNIPSDLLVFFGDLYWRSIGSVGSGRIHSRVNDTGPDGANHDWDGIFVMVEGRDLVRGARAGTGGDTGGGTGGRAGQAAGRGVDGLGAVRALAGPAAERTSQGPGGGRRVSGMQLTDIAGLVLEAFRD